LEVQKYLTEAYYFDRSSPKIAKYAQNMRSIFPPYYPWFSLKNVSVARFLNRNMGEPDAKAKFSFLEETHRCHIGAM
jgi:hypothetical protein